MSMSIKMVCVVRSDLGMGVGKIAAQVGHAGKLISTRLLSVCNGNEVS